MATVAATAAASSREARRRRILDRGSDRLALITGQIQSLPPQSEQQLRPQTSTPSESSERKDDKVSDLNEESGSEPSKSRVLKVEDASSRGVDEPLGALRSTSTSQETNKDPLNENIPRNVARAAALLGMEEELSRIMSSAKSSGQEQSHQRTKTVQTTGTPAQTHAAIAAMKCTPAQVRSAISATENIRSCSSAVFAILVILSYAGFPLLGSPGVRAVILLKPVLMLLLTNISIMVARIFSTEGRTRQSSLASAVGIGKAIEAGLMLQSIFTALLMDFGIYAVLLICGHSLIQRLGHDS